MENFIVLADYSNDCGHVNGGGFTLKHSCGQVLTPAPFAQVILQVVWHELDAAKFIIISVASFVLSDGYDVEGHSIAADVEKIVRYS
jgi:hypothetical protein